MENIIGTYCNNCRLPYCICEIKHPKQVGEIEAVDSEQIIKFIAQRIKDEQRKHEQFQDMWHEIAARKIYKSFNITTRNI